MLKKILALSLAVILACLCFGCGAKTDGQTTAKSDTNETDVPPSTLSASGKIAVIVGDSAQEPELYAAAKQLLDAYGDSVMILRYSASYLAVNTGLTDSALAAARDNQVKALIFAGGVNGTANAAKQARAERSDLCIIACNPLEGAEALSESADLVLSVDFAKLAGDLIAGAKAMGAANYVFYTTNRTLKLKAVSGIRSTTTQTCKADEMGNRIVNCVDPYSADNTLELAEQFIAEDAQRRLEEYGEKTALFCTEPVLQGAVAKAAASRGMVVPGTFMPSPIALAQGLGVDLTGHEADSAYALEQLRAAAAENKTAGHVATWSFSAPVGLLQAAFDYAVAVLQGEAGQTPEEAAVKPMILAHTDDAVRITAQKGVFLITADPVIL